MKNDSLITTAFGRILLQLGCAMRRPFHWNWHWQGIQRELRTIRWSERHGNGFWELFSFPEKVFSKVFDPFAYVLTKGRCSVLRETTMKASNSAMVRSPSLA